MCNIKIPVYPEGNAGVLLFRADELSVLRVLAPDIENDLTRIESAIRAVAKSIEQSSSMLSGTDSSERLSEIQERLAKSSSAPWGIMLDGPRGDGKPWTAYREAAPGLTIGSPDHTEPVARVSGYLRSAEANAALIANAPADLQFLLADNERLRAEITKLDGFRHEADTRAHLNWQRYLAATGREHEALARIAELENQLLET